MKELDYSRHYLRWHDTSDQHASNVGKGEYATLRQFLPENRNIQIMDFGCGMGFALTGLKEAGYRALYGIDADRSQVAQAKRRGLNVELVPVDITLNHLNKNKEHFDVVISLDVLEHIPTGTLIDVLAAIKETLKPGGIFICRVPNCNSMVASRMRYLDWTHVTAFAESSLDFVLFGAGFKDIRVLPQPDPMPRRPTYLMNWALRKTLRSFHRLAFVAEFGLKEAAAMPMSPNIWGICKA